jgi:hypothetical protein
MTCLAIIAAAFWLGSAVCWTVSARIKVRVSMDDFMDDLHRIGAWNARAAWLACAAAVCAMALELLRAAI